MSLYPRAVPAELYDSDSAEEYEFFDCSSGLEKVQVAQKVNIGFRAGKNGENFDIKLDEDSQKTFDELNRLWMETSKSPKLLIKIEEAFRNSSNPFALALQFYANTNKQAKTESFSFGILEALENHKKDSPKSSELLDENLKFVAFNFFCDKNFMTIKKAVEVFEMAKSNEIFVDQIKLLLESRKFKDAAQLAIELKLFNEFGLDDLLLPLFLEDKISLFESYLDNAAHLHEPILKFLDSLLAFPIDVFEKCEPLLDKYLITDLKTAKLNEKSVHTLIGRLLKKFKIKDAIAPNYTRYTHSKRLGFILKFHYVSKKTSRQAFEDNLKDFFKRHGSSYHAELLNRCVELDKLEDAVNFMKMFKISRSKAPRDLIDFMNGVTPAKQPRLISPNLFTCSDDGWDVPAPKIIQFYELKLEFSKILFVDTVATYWDMLHRLNFVKEIAFDIEHCLSGSIGIIQLATRENVFIIDIIALQKLHLDEVFWNILSRRFFNNDEVMKLGFDVTKDIQMMRTIPELSIKNPSKAYHDLKKVAMEAYEIPGFRYPHHELLRSIGLSKLTQLCLGRTLDKGNQMSDWSLRPLRKDQIIYAATDAFVLFEIYDVMTTILSKLGVTEDELMNNEP